jgi:hypothetical protein
MLNEFKDSDYFLSFCRGLQPKQPSVFALDSGRVEVDHQVRVCYEAMCSRNYF